MQISTLFLLSVLGGCSTQVPTPSSNEEKDGGTTQDAPAVPPKSDTKREVLMKAVPADPLAGARKAPIVPITNIHEHVWSMEELPKLITGMDNMGIERTVVLGSPLHTFALGQTSFTHYDENNDRVLGMATLEPDRIIPFVVLNPNDADAVEKLRAYAARGARGVKLFAGHGSNHGLGPYHTMRLDDKRLHAIYSAIEELGLPVLFHVNYSKYSEEFDNAMSAHPKMRVLCPHFCLSLRNTTKVDELLARYPNLWMDTSIGWIKFQAEGYRRIDVKPDVVKAIIQKYPDRFLYGTDLVITSSDAKSAEWVTMNMGFYRDVLERESYSYYGLSGGPLTGLALSEDILTRVYRDNATAWPDGSPQP